MPKLIVQRPPGRRKKPPCGRLINYVEPRSPFQKLVDGKMRELRLSCRGLAKEIGVAQSTMWIWLHSENGYPHPKAFKPEHLQKLCRALKLKAGDVQHAIDASRLVYLPQQNPMPAESVDAFKTFITILENDKRAVVTRKYVLNLALNLYNGATVPFKAGPVPPASRTARS